MTTTDVECLLCHAVHTGSLDGDPSGSWRCHRCGQQWDAARMATVMDYLKWAKAEAAAVPATAA